MGTRSGNIDPAIMEFIAKKENLDIEGVMNVLNKKSGLLGLSGGLSSDFRDLNEAAEGGNEDAANAIDVLCYGIAKFVGGYVAAMNGVDAIVFTAGIGENAIPVREKVVSYLGYLGVTLDKDANGHRGEEIVISTPDSKVKVAVIPTNEELAICRETVALVYAAVSVSVQNRSGMIGNQAELYITVDQQYTFGGGQLKVHPRNLP